MRWEPWHILGSTKNISIKKKSWNVSFKRELAVACISFVSANIRWHQCRLNISRLTNSYTRSVKHFLEAEKKYHKRFTILRAECISYLVGFLSFRLRCLFSDRLRLWRNQNKASTTPHIVVTMLSLQPTVLLCNPKRILGLKDYVAKIKVSEA